MQTLQIQMNVNVWTQQNDEMYNQKQWIRNVCCSIIFWDNLMLT